VLLSTSVKDEGAVEGSFIGEVDGIKDGYMFCGTLGVTLVGSSGAMLGTEDGVLGKILAGAILGVKDRVVGVVDGVNSPNGVTLGVEDGVTFGDEIAVILGVALGDEDGTALRSFDGVAL